MKIMYIIALVSFLALAGAAVAITRHVRKNARRAETPGSGLGDSKALEDRLTDVARGLRPLPAHATLASAATTPPGSAPEGPGTTPSDDTPETAKVEDHESKDIKSGDIKAEDIKASSATEAEESVAEADAIPAAEVTKHP